jgi:hypothetical protein
MLKDNRESITGKIGLGFEAVRIGIRDAAKPRSLNSDIFTCDLESIVKDYTEDSKRNYIVSSTNNAKTSSDRGDRMMLSRKLRILECNRLCLERK